MTRLQEIRWARLERLMRLGPEPKWYRPFKRRAWRKAYAAVRTVSVEELGLITAEVYEGFATAYASMTSPMLRIVKNKDVN